MNRHIMTLMKKLSRVFPDELVIKWKYFILNGHFPDLKTPKTYNEKLLWLNIHNHDPRLTIMVDKYRVREYVKEKIGEQYLIPLLAVWDSVEEIDFSTLPDQFVLKCNHDSGSVVVCKDKSKLDIAKTKEKLDKALKSNYYYHSREWAYKNVEPKIICEALIPTNDGEVPKDYKIFCCNGVPQMFFVASDRGRGTKFDFYSMEGNHLPVSQHYPNSGADTRFDKPARFNEMIECAKVLSQDFPQVRVDFYEDKYGNVLFGELTFIHFSGMHDFEPKEFNYKFGDVIDLSKFDKKC